GRPDRVLSETLMDASAKRVASGPATPRKAAAPAKPTGQGAATGRKPPSDKRPSERRPPSRNTAFPQTLPPQLATLASQPTGGNWLYDIKFDGYRLMIRFDARGKVTLFTRNGHDWSHRLAAQCKALASLKLKNTWLDGELVVLNEDGMPDFQALQNAFDA